jgi:hypothetical protein
MLMSVIKSLVLASDASKVSQQGIGRLRVIDQYEGGDKRPLPASILVLQTALRSAYAYAEHNTKPAFDALRTKKASYNDQV